MAKKAAPKNNKRWVKKVSETSDAMDLDEGVFKKEPKAVAQSLKRSVLKSKRRKAGPFQSAMSMLNYQINRGGKGLSKEMKDNLEKAKPELRKAFGREEEGGARNPKAGKKAVKKTTKKATTGKAAKKAANNATKKTARKAAKKTARKRAAKKVANK